MIVLDVGCGVKKIKNSIGIDRSSDSKADVICDISSGLPFKDNSVDKVYVLNVLEHFLDTVSIVRDIWRITKPGTRVIIKVPHFSSLYAWIDPDHQKAFSYTTFDSFAYPHQNYNFKDIKFKIIKKRLIYDNLSVLRKRFKRNYLVAIIIIFYMPIIKIIEFFANIFPLFCERFWCYYVGGFNTIYLELETIK